MNRNLRRFLLLLSVLLCASSAILGSVTSRASDYQEEDGNSEKDGSRHGQEDKDLYQYPGYGDDGGYHHQDGSCQSSESEYLPPAFNPTIQLRNGAGMPQFSLGLAHASIQGAPFGDGSDNRTFVGFFPAVAYRQIELALQSGIRAFDTALIYGTQPHLGQILGQWWASGRLQARHDVFITTKVYHMPAPKFGLKRNHQWNLGNMTPEEVTVLTEDHIELCLKELQIGYIDLLLMHWPSGPGHDETASRQRRIAAWKVFEDFYERGWLRAIGVSNFAEHHIEQLIEDGATILPMVNQIEASAYIQHEDILQYCHARDILVQSYAPLGSGVMNIQGDPVLRQLARAHGKDVGQVVLRYLFQRGYTITFSTTSPRRMVSNLDIFDFELDDDEMHEIYDLTRPPANGTFGLPSPYELP